MSGHFFQGFEKRAGTDSSNRRDKATAAGGAIGAITGLSLASPVALVAANDPIMMADRARMRALFSRGSRRNRYMRFANKALRAAKIRAGTVAGLGLGLGGLAGGTLVRHLTSPER